jgi:cytidylate kinase
MASREGWSPEQALARCVQVDRTRDRFTRYFFGPNATDPEQYDLVINTAWMPLEDAVTLVTALVQDQLAALPASRSGRHVLTLSRQLGAGETSFAPALAARLGLKVFDRELLFEQALRLRVTEAQLAGIDEQPADLLQRLRSGDLPERGLIALRQIMTELAEAGNALIVGRAGNHLLREQTGAFHVRIVAPLETRLRRVMEHRWVLEGPARQLITQSDERRHDFVRGAFGADWADPKEYHLTVNTGRLGPMAVELVAAAAQLHWTRA